MKQNRKEFSSYFSRSIKQNKPLYLLLMSWGTWNIETKMHGRIKI